jgi:hypothetical protein
MGWNNSEPMQSIHNGQQCQVDQDAHKALIGKVLRAAIPENNENDR